MVARGGHTSSSPSRSKWGSGKRGALRNFMGGVPLLKQQWRNQGKVESSIDKDGILSQDREEALKQVEENSSRSQGTEPKVLSPTSLDAPVLTSIVESAAHAKGSGTLDNSSGCDENNNSTLKISNDNRNRSEESNSITLNTDVEIRQQDTPDASVNNNQIILREDTSAEPLQDDSEKTIIKLLLSDVWSGNEQIVECSLKLINICLERDPSAARAMVPVGGHSVMLGIMKKWRSHAKIQAHACHFLGKCCASPNNKAFADAALKYGAFQKLNRALLKFPKYLMVQTAACQAIEQMLLVCTDHKTVVEGINVVLIVAAMQTFGVTAPLQKAGAGILHQLTTTNDDPVIARTIITTGGLEVLSAAYHHFSDTNDVDHCAIRDRCRATIPYLLADPASKESRRCSFYTVTTPTNAGCMSSFFVCNS